MKKALSFVCCLALSALILSCGSTARKMPKVGIIQLVEHAALDASCKGFIDGLAESGYVSGTTIEIDFQNAQGEQANCQTIAQKLVNDRDDLILAIATPAAQAVANQTSTIPILVTAVTDPATAKLVKSNELPGTNVSGTSDLNPVDAQMDLIKQLVPGVKKVGLLYCSSEQNSKFQVEMAKKALDKLGIGYIEATVSNSNEIQQVVQSLVGKVEALYSPTDNMIAAGVPNVMGVAIPAKLPFICGEPGMVTSGGLATLGIDYYKLGKQTAAMAVEILKNGKKPADMPIQYQSDFVFSINKETAQKIGITIPAELLAKVQQ